ncbi:TCP-1/cpn60 chaperonin family protein [Halorubrum vacuolatum]|nr:TCP-1/cpn60 chaperonin family protein [Halorubrum vacuolatum]
MEIVPRTLATNAGTDPIEVVARLRTRHDAGDTDAGVGPSGSVQDMTAAGVVEPAAVVSGCLTTAVETAVILLRIDDVLDAEETASAATDPHDHAHDHGEEHGQTGGHDHGGYPWALSH